jgi:phosphopantetheinyl transferase (holo-ACP synthase)
VSSAGNDIVALKAIDKLRTNHRRFYSKILSDAEQSLYNREHGTEMPFENFVWLLWSIKESVYKYLKRSTPGLVFSPAKILVRNISSPGSPAGPYYSSPAGPLCSSPAAKSESTQWESRETGSREELYKGIALFESRLFHFQSKIHPEFISTVVNDTESFENIWWGIKQIGYSDYESQSVSVRHFVLNKLNVVLSGDEDDLRIGKSRMGYPVVLKGEVEMNIPVSLAHHDHFIAYSFLLPLSPAILPDSALIQLQPDTSVLPSLFE